MSENVSTGILFKEALLEYSQKHRNDGVCGIKIDMRSQAIDLIVGIRFEDGASHFTVCTAGNNCEGAEDSVFENLSGALKELGIESKGGAGIMIKRNAKIITTDEGCATIENIDAPEVAAKEAPKKSGGFFGMFGKK